MTSTPPFFLRFDRYQDHSFEGFHALLQEVERKAAGEVTIRDLCAVQELPNGVYFLFERSQLQYVGRCTSRSFVERVPSHFDPREAGWFNTVPKKLSKRRPSYAAAHSDALNFTLAMLGIPDAREAMALETAFRHNYQPVLNTPNRPRRIDEGTTLKEGIQAYGSFAKRIMSAIAPLSD